MDRRQQKTQKAIFDAFTTLLAEKHYNSITVQNIIDAADVGRTTFYAHYETKDDLLKSVCEELFGHIMDKAAEMAHSHGSDSSESVHQAVFYHLLQHLHENDNNILGLLSCQSNDLFLQYFKSSMNQMLKENFSIYKVSMYDEIPQDFLIHHITGSFVEMINWWVKGHMEQTPQELGQYFCAVIEPIEMFPLDHCK